MTTYTIQTRDGRTVTRKSDATYTHAAVHTRDHGRHSRGDVTFHGSHGAAVRASGRAGYVVAVDSQTRQCGACGGTGGIPSRSAVTGAVTTFACNVCGGTGRRAA
jgi:hypothetical protein